MHWGPKRPIPISLLCERSGCKMLDTFSGIRIWSIRSNCICRAEKSAWLNYYIRIRVSRALNRPHIAEDLWICGPRRLIGFYALCTRKQLSQGWTGPFFLLYLWLQLHKKKLDYPHYTHTHTPVHLKARDNRFPSHSLPSAFCYLLPSSSRSPPPHTFTGGLSLVGIHQGPSLSPAMPQRRWTMAG